MKKNILFLIASVLCHYIHPMEHDFFIFCDRKLSEVEFSSTAHLHGIEIAYLQYKIGDNTITSYKSNFAMITDFRISLYIQTNYHSLAPYIQEKVDNGMQQCIEHVCNKAFNTHHKDSILIRLLSNPHQDPAHILLFQSVGFTLTGKYLIDGKILNYLSRKNEKGIINNYEWKKYLNRDVVEPRFKTDYYDPHQESIEQKLYKLRQIKGIS